MLKEINLWLHEIHFITAYLIIVVFTAIIYKTVFSSRLPLLKNLLVFVFLTIGCLLLGLFHLMGFPIIPVLVITTFLIILTKIRLYYSKVKKDK